MGIYLPNMEMPKSCGVCKFFASKRGVGQHCAVDDRITFHATLNGFDVGYERNGNCPLVPVPPHGRLIDADAAIANRNKDTNWCYDLCDLPEYLSDCPTIIPTEEGEA